MMESTSAMWKLFQFSIAAAVMWSDITYHWSTGPMVAPFLAVCAAFLATALILAIVDLVRRGKAAIARLCEPTEQTGYRRIR